MAAIYGGSAAGDPVLQPWFPIFQAVFDNLAAVSGLRFVYEPNDDGVGIDGSTGSSDWGSLGIRGDIRISGHAIDGNSGVLAYAYYPDNGEVVIDTNDNYIDIILAGDEAGAEEAYRAVLPAIVFIMQSIESLLCYGKRIFGARAGIAIHDRGPALRPSRFGLDLVAKYAEALGPYRERLTG